MNSGSEVGYLLAYSDTIWESFMAFRMLKLDPLRKSRTWNKIKWLIVQILLNTLCFSFVQIIHFFTSKLWLVEIKRKCILCVTKVAFKDQFDDQKVLKQSHNTQDHAKWLGNSYST